VAGWQSTPVSSDTYFGEYARLMYPGAVAAEVAPALEELSSAEEIFMSALGAPTIHRLWADPLDPARLPALEAKTAQLQKARLLANSAQERLERALQMKGDPATLKSLLLASRMFDYLGMKNLYAIEWSGYFKKLKESPTPELIDLYLRIQMEAQDHGMIADLIDAITGLREQYRTAWLEESTDFRLGAALSRWDAEAQYWRTLQARIPEVSRGYRKGEPFPSIDVIRPKR
jgi:hypothetical protein